VREQLPEHINIVRVATNVQVKEVRKVTGHGKLWLDMLEDDVKNLQGVMGRK
jgi:hypothetical protein